MAEPVEPPPVDLDALRAAAEAEAPVLIGPDAPVPPDVAYIRALEAELSASRQELARHTAALAELVAAWDEADEHGVVGNRLNEAQNAARAALAAAPREVTDG